MLLQKITGGSRKTFLLGLLTILPAILFLSGLLLGEYIWWLDYINHLRILFGFIFFFLIIIASLFQFWFGAFLSFGMSTVIILSVSNLFFQPTHQKSKESDAKIVLFNVYRDNQDKTKVINYITSINPHLFIIQEINFQWQPYLKKLDNHYSFKKTIFSDDGLGLGIYSHFPFKDLKIIKLIHDMPSILVTCISSLGTFHLLNLHAFPPLGKQRSQWRNTQFDQVAQALNQLNGPKLLVGDLNTTPWSPFFKKLLQATELQDSSNGYGWQPSWPAIGFFPPLITIDHVLYSKQIHITNRKTHTFNLGSDHLPVEITFTLNQR